MLNTHQRISDMQAFDELSMQTKAIVYASLRALMNDIERMKQSPAYETLNASPVTAFHEQLIFECTQNMAAIENTTAKEDLQLLTLFGN